MGKGNVGCFDFLALQQFSQDLTPFLHGLPKGSHHKKMRTCHLKMSVLLIIYSLDDQGQLGIIFQADLDISTKRSSVMKNSHNERARFQIFHMAVLLMACR